MGAFTPLASPDLTGRERQYLLEAFDSGYLTHVGVWNQRLEARFSEWIGKPSLACSSGTAALHLALMSLGVGEGDEVICPTLTFGATAAVIAQVGAKPVLVDVTSKFGIDWDQAREKVTRRTKAVMAVHLYGEDAGVEDIGVPVLEDSCEALGMEVRGHLAAFSFYGNKTMTTGEGGMLVGKLGDAKLYRDAGFQGADYDMVVPGLNYRMTNLQAAIGCAQLERVDDLIAQRKANAYRYSVLKGAGKWLFVLDCDNPVSMGLWLKKNGIETRPVFRPLHLTKAFRQSGDFPVAERIWERGLCLPTGPHLEQLEQSRIISLVDQHIRGTSSSRS